MVAPAQQLGGRLARHPIGGERQQAAGVAAQRLRRVAGAIVEQHVRLAAGQQHEITGHETEFLAVVQAQAATPGQQEVEDGLAGRQGRMVDGEAAAEQAADIERDAQVGKVEQRA